MLAVCVTKIADSLKVKRDLSSAFLAFVGVQATACADNAQQCLYE